MLIWWLLRGYVTFAVCFALGAVYIAWLGATDGLVEAGGGMSVLSGWLLWGVMMVPLVGVVSLAVGGAARLLQASSLRPTSAGAITGVLAGAGAALVAAWFSGWRSVDALAVVILWAVVASTVGFVARRDALGTAQAPDAGGPTPDRPRESPT
ncbi:hypothetical protein ASG78_09470 [Nostocoides sp. Soil756]|nr:hypothetical protein ASG78_09470 [Tetrasphaera sp. Soil756]